MNLPTPLLRGTLVKRYKRFLADVILDSGETVTATCPNTGSMKGLTAPGTPVWLSRSDNPKRKYAHTWELLELDGGDGGKAMVGINTNHPNKLATEAIKAGQIEALAGYDGIRREVKYGQNSRIDILLTHDVRPHCYVEVKNVHLSRSPGLAEFPDSVTERGTKHLRELSDMVRQGARAVMFYLIQRDDVNRFALAGDIDPVYATAFKAARAAGVEVLAYRCALSVEAINVSQSVPIDEPE